MNEQEAVKWYRRGVTPGWLEHTLLLARSLIYESQHEFPDDKVWRIVANECGDHSGRNIAPPELRTLADYWGIE